jgi:hypothetical protein
VYREFQNKIFGFCLIIVLALQLGIANGQNSDTTISGKIRQLIFEGNPVRYEYSLVTETGRSYQLSGSKSLVKYVNQVVSLSGILEGSWFKVISRIEIVDNVASSTIPPPTFGERKVLVLLVNFQNDQTQPISVDEARERVFTGAESAAQYFKEASYYRFKLTSIQRSDGDVVGWMTLPFADTGCDIHTQWTNGAKDLARQRGYEPDNYNTVFYVFPHLCFYRTHTFRGVIGDMNTRTPVWANANTFTAFTAIHELGHNLGLPHANSYVCNGDRIPEDCQSMEYGDIFDQMGDYSPSPSFFFNNYYRLSLGWLTGRTLTVTSSGDYTLLAPSVAAKGNQVLRIQTVPPVPNYAGFSYTLEFRRPFSFDRRLVAPGWDYSNAFEGVSIRYTQNDPVAAQTHLIDATPRTSSIWDAPLKAGETFTDIPRGISITTLSVNPFRGARVRIQLPNTTTTSGPTSN